tara:strand:- start:1820 stop:2161 length:342 start_codon:yes stop_codon:yes gene_type:complete
MRDIDKLYHNDFGISFFWKSKLSRKNSLVDIVFRDSGLSLRTDEIKTMYDTVKGAVEKSSLCIDCKNNKDCKPFLLEIPNAMVSFAMSYQEMKEMSDLLRGTLFHLELNHLLK